MRIPTCSILLAGLLTLVPLAAEDGSSLDWYLSVHGAMPMANLSTDVDGKLGFGFSLGFEQPLSRRLAVRGNFSWTGYRVDERNLWEKAFASIFDASYSEDRMVLRSYTLGMEFIGYLEDGGRGAYLLGGGGIQRSRLYLEHVVVDSGNHESTDNLASWPAADTPYLCVGMGYQGRSPAFIEGRFQYFRYNGVRGYALLDTPLNGRPSLRDGVGLTFALGARF